MRVWAALAVMVLAGCDGGTAPNLHGLLGPRAAVDSESERTVEEWAISATKGTVRRDGDRLVLGLEAGGTVEFSDYLGAPQGGKYWDAVRHVFRGRLRQYYLLERTAYGRVHGVLVEATAGQSWTAPGRPMPSPDGSRFIAVGDGGGGSEARLQIWALTEARPRVELDLLPRRPLRFAGWDGNDRVSIDLPADGAAKTLWLERRFGAWVVPAPLAE